MILSIQYWPKQNKLKSNSGLRRLLITFFLWIVFTRVNNEYWNRFLKDL
jgi:hypothetical protein